MKLLTVLNVCSMTFANSFAQAAVERSNHAESKRTSSAKIIHAENELQASGQLLTGTSVGRTTRSYTVTKSANID